MENSLANFIKYCLGYIKITRERTAIAQQKYSFNLPVKFFSLLGLLNGDTDGVVLKNTDWPVGSYSLKALAQYLGFSWRDKTPSGALSIQWFNDYIQTKDESILNRILLYNEDDCRATMVLKDGIVKLSIQD